MYTSEEKIKIGCYLTVIAFNLFMGTWSVDYLLRVILDKGIPFYADAILGLIGGQVTVPTAVVVWILRYFGVF